MKLRFGIIGPGRISERFARAASGSDRAEVIAAASRERSRAEAFARNFPGVVAEDDYLSLIRDPEVDAVYVGLTHNLHYKAARLCLENGKPVLCEKPLVTNRRDAEELVALSRSRDVLLMEAMWTRCMPAFRTARDWIREGRIGSPRVVQASFSSKAPFDPEGRLFNPALAGGALFDVGVYTIMFATGLLGESPSSVAGAAFVGPTGVDYSASISLGFPCGAVASLTCGLLSRLPLEARIYGESGFIVVPEFYGPRGCELYDGEGLLVERFESSFTDGFIFQIEHFADLYRSGKKESNLIPHADSIACASILDELRTQWGLA